MAAPAYRLVTVRLPAGVASTLADVAQHLAVADSDIDAAFGVVTIEPETRTVALRLVAAQVAGVAARLGDGVSGPFSDPSVGPV